MIWDWNWTLEILPSLLTQGLLVTVQATLGGAVLAFVLGLFVALLRRSRRAYISRPVGAIMEFIRSTPLLVQLFVLYYVLPDFGFKMTALTTGIIGLGVHYAAYTSEVYRAGIDGVPKGQWEAAIALNMPRPYTWISIVLPQAVRRALPALGNYVVAIFKESPQLSVITVVDVVGLARGVGSESFRYLEPMTIAGLFFLLIAIPASMLVRRMERRLDT
ncbi:ectoine/hydroxyectoine ABC transporter permease subunit EhuD [Nonomuraea sp. KC401]|uniref:ectoine/hydroxyectoine ABC transporter permease subunit EhuD n=1 Tax=unclassified Nonomuraea TaxID=2593643 RepID=UPI0010FD8C97|nr:MULTISPECIES: ectoine/hydroxyectoine ABC transporter permease subunit EhuD [unclassified Nonomuraea]NBE91993.1 ectoine/hydroxyectoine ABC transporter permease subunit EhuD [Nonomuraea sp. K271]TLF74199.1 ectoine/hydroxyectoine ABC transporter permease subunit EhuD [Nonomuraea sp. KC401]